MSAQQQRSRGPKGFYRPQARYVPKSGIASSASAAAGDQLTSSDRKPAPPLTSSLRSSATSKSSPTITGDDDIGGSGFVRYLPHDEAVASGLGADAGGLDAVESQAVVDFLNDELSRLLKMKPRDFWKEVAKNDSLHQFLDSYLQFRRRWYDFSHRGSRGMVAGIIVGEVDLCRRVFFILYRISTNRAPGVRACDCLSLKDHTALLQEKKLLDLPKLLDICAIYGRENGELTTSLVTNAIKILPQLPENLGGVVSQFLNIIHTMYERCITSLEVLDFYAGDRGHGLTQLIDDFLEVMDFVNDAIMTLDAFADAYKPSALNFTISFETSHGNDELLHTLARLHDSLIPSMLRAFSLASSNVIEDNRRKISESIPNVFLSLKMLSMRMVKFGGRLLEQCYLNNGFTEGDILQSTSKVFPAGVEDPSIRGDILVQMLKEINEEAKEYNELGTFNENIEKNFKIFGRIKSLCAQGWISLDEEQLQYLSQILNSSSSTTSESELAAPVSSCVNYAHVVEDSVFLDSKISQIKDLFPDYGTAFLKACLEIYNHDAEEVIQHILEGTLHEDLSSLDTSAEQIPSLNPTFHRGNDNKGKAIFIEPSSEKIPAFDLKSQDADTSSTSRPSFGRYTRKVKNGDLNSELLDSKSAKDAVRSAVLAAEFEYEDEYDDSFDDLGLSAVESGFEETEILSDGTHLMPEKLTETEISSSSRWNSQKKPQFYVKDGKNYSYKVAGSVAVANAKDAAIWNQSQKELIHGLGRGGNLPIGAVKIIEDNDKKDQEVSDPRENLDGGNSGFRGRGGRGRGRWHHTRKEKAMKKHLSGLSGY